MGIATEHDDRSAPVDPEALRDEVRARYREVADTPQAKFHFHTGRELARRCGYDMAPVDDLPDVAVESFAGVANPFAEPMSPITVTSSGQAPTVDPEALRAEVRTKYAEVATNPHGSFHFHTGRPLAVKLGYPTRITDTLPESAVESFADVEIHATPVRRRYHDLLPHQPEPPTCPTRTTRPSSEPPKASPSPTPTSNASPTRPRPAPTSHNSAREADAREWVPRRASESAADA